MGQYYLNPISGLVDYFLLLKFTEKLHSQGTNPRPLCHIIKYVKNLQNILAMRTSFYFNSSVVLTI
jgi:hypothetical protein